MAAGDNVATGVRIVHVSPDPTYRIKIKVPGNVEIARGAPIQFDSGIGKQFTAANTDCDDFVGIALTANEGDESSAIRNEITVSMLCVIEATFSSAPSASEYIGHGVECTAGSVTTHIFTFGVVTDGADQIGWLLENGDASKTTLKVLIDSMATSKGQQVAGEGFWEQNAATGE